MKMRLIQPTLLLLLVAIHCESCPLLYDPDAEWDRQLKTCVDKKCQRQQNECKRNPHCFRGYFHCMARRGICLEKLKKQACFHCGYSFEALRLTQCAVQKDCIPTADISCPGERTEGREVPLNLPNLVQKLKGNEWWAVATADPYKNGHFNNPCSRYLLYEDSCENVLLHLSTFYGNSKTGECLTKNQNYYGNGTQRGNSGILDFILTKEDYRVPTNPTGTNKLTMYFHELVEGGRYAVVSFCVITEKGKLLLSKKMIISKFKTLESLQQNIDNATLTKFSQAVSKLNGVHAMDNANCKN